MKSAISHQPSEIPKHYYTIPGISTTPQGVVASVLSAYRSATRPSEKIECVHVAAFLLNKNFGMNPYEISETICKASSAKKLSYQGIRYALLNIKNRIQLEQTIREKIQAIECGIKEAGSSKSMANGLRCHLG